MPRWEPNARSRLAQAALTLYAKQGFDHTTAAQIATLAGLTERTFFRHFSDKREVLFHGTEMAQDLLTRTIADAPASATPTDTVIAALQATAAVMQRDPERARLRDTVIAANPELQERELIKLATFASAMTGALRDRGTPEPAASLAAEAGIAVFKVAFARWINQADQPDLPTILGDCMHELRNVLAESRTELTPAA
jgi:AcrR family transcriptional regulator